MKWFLNVVSCNFVKSVEYYSEEKSAGGRKVMVHVRTYYVHIVHCTSWLAI